MSGASSSTTDAAAPRGSTRRWPPRLSSGIGAVFVAWGAVIGIDRLADNSFFTHLATGRLIVDSGIPREDPYSFTAAGEPWIVQSWLASAAYGVIDELAGGAGLRLLTSALAAVLAGLVWRLTRPATALAPRVAIAGLALTIGTTFWSPRPLLMGLVLLAVTLVLVTERHDPRWLVPVLVVWVNVHGSWPLGLVAIGCLALGTWLDGEGGREELTALLWAGGTGVVAAVVNPIGPRLLLFPVELLGRSDVLRAVVEWQSPSFDQTWARIFLVQVALAVVLLVRRPSYRAAVPLVVFTAAALLGLRNAPVASLVLVPGLAAGLAGLGSLDGRRRDPAGLVVLVGAVAMAAVAVIGALGEDDYDLRAYPTASLVWATEVGLAGDPDVRLVTEEVVGNVLELQLGTEANVFLDDRVDMYPVPVVEDYLALARGGDAALEVLDRWEVDAVLWPEGGALSALLTATGDWRVVHVEEGEVGSTWVTLCRRGAAACDGLGTVVASGAADGG